MKHVMQKRAENHLSDEATEKRLEDFVKSEAYLCKMLWLQRTDKLSEDDYPFLVWLTNEYAELKPEDKLDEDFKPKYGNTVLFSGKYDYSELVYNIEKNMFESLKKEMLKEEKKTSFFEKIKAWF